MKLQDTMSIRQFADECSDFLGIKCPKITFGFSKLKQGNLSVLVLDENKQVKSIKVSDECEDILDIYFAICHELRHVYQTVYAPDLFSQYATIDDGLSTEEYNLQPAEIDANAFASVYMREKFGVSPLFRSYSEKVKNEIYLQMKKF